MDERTIILQILGSSLPVVIITEITLAALWIPWYFRSGFVVYRKRMQYSSGFPLLDTEKLSKAASSSVLYDTKLKRVGLWDMLFRNTLSMFQLTKVTIPPLLRGSIKCARDSGYVVVIGRLNWTPIVTLFWVCVILVLGNIPVAIAVLSVVWIIVVFSLWGVHQIRAFNRVASAVARELGSTIEPF